MKIVRHTKKRVITVKIMHRRPQNDMRETLLLTVDVRLRSWFHAWISIREFDVFYISVW